MKPHVRTFALLLAALPVCGAAGDGTELPTGRYRCYQPPSYVVTAWFDIEPGHTYRFQGEAPQPFRYDPVTRRIVWTGGELAQAHAGGTYHPPTADSALGSRHAIVLEPRARRDAGPVTECFLTTH